MTVLVDANILLRLAEPGHPMYADAFASVTALRTRGYSLAIVPQCLYEFWVVCTRPVTVNGLGKTAAEAHAEVLKLMGLFPLLDDTPLIFPEWLNLVTAYAVEGKNAHDARLVAAMSVHGLTHLLTFNDADFRRFPTIQVLTPTAVLAAQSP